MDFVNALQKEHYQVTIEDLLQTSFIHSLNLEWAVKSANDFNKALTKIDNQRQLLYQVFS